MEHNEEEQYREVINTLKSLQQVKAPAYFEADLMRRINSETNTVKESFWRRLFIPSRFVPSAALAVTTIIILFVLNINPGDTDNPLLSEPRVRQDIIASNNLQDVELNKENLNKEKVSTTRKRTEENLIAETEVGSTYTAPPEYPVQNVSTFIDKNGLNFRHITIPKEQMEQIRRMRERLMLMLESNSGK